MCRIECVIKAFSLITKLHSLSLWFGTKDALRVDEWKSSDISVTSPQELVIFIIKETNISWMKVKPKKPNVILRLSSLPQGVQVYLHKLLKTSASFLAEISVRSPRKLFVFVI